MRDVATQLVNWQTFIGSARGFLHGRVDCGPLDSPLLMERFEGLVSFPCSIRFKCKVLSDDDSWNFCA